MHIPSSNVPEMRPLVFSQFYQKIAMETMTARKYRLQCWLCISKFYNCTKFHYHQKAEQKVINYQNFQFFLFLTTLKKRRHSVFMALKKPSSRK